MLKNNMPQVALLQGNFQLETGKSIKRVIEHMERLLPTFVCNAKTQNIHAENRLNHLYVRVMDIHELFQFMHEDYEVSSNAAIDIGIYTRGDNKSRFFAIEGKRLDTNIGNYTQRKKEYVVNNNGGGIERFKKDIHGKELLCAGMLGYVQTDDFNTWERRINSYIAEEIRSSTIGVSWNTDDLLRLEKSDVVCATYGSKHLRLSGSEIDLYHLWVNLQ